MVPAPMYSIPIPSVLPPSPAHSTGIKMEGVVALYAALSVLGFSVIFFVLYHTVKAYRNVNRRNRQMFAIQDGGISPRADNRSSGRISTFLQKISQRRLRLPAAHLTRTNQQELRDPAIQQWAATYLRHVRNMDDYAAGMPRVVQSQRPIPTPPPLYSSVCQASVATIGLAADLKRPPLVPYSMDPEADITDIIKCYDASFTGSFSSSSDSSATSFDDDMFGAIPIIVVDSCEDIVPPPYEEDITDQCYGGSVADASAEMARSYLSPRYKARADRMASHSDGRRRQAKAAQSLGRGGSLFARLTGREGFFRLPTLRTKQSTAGRTATN